MEDGRRVAIVESQPELGRMLKGFLTEEGYEVHLHAEETDLVEKLRDLRPDALILDLPGVAELEVLDQLRTDHVTAEVPILVIARSKDLSKRSLASYNVKKTITKPFDPEDLLTKLRQVLRQLPLHAQIPPESTHDGIIGMAEYVLARHSRAALVRWVQLLQDEPPWRDRKDLDFTSLVDVTPVVVESLVAAFHYKDPLRFFEDHPDAVERIRRHGEIRRSQKLPLTSLMREYSLLRDEIWATLWSRLPRTLHSTDVLNLQRIVHGCMDYIGEEVMSAYAEQPRPLQAEQRESDLDRVVAETAGGSTARVTGDGGEGRAA